MSVKAQTQVGIGHASRLELQRCGISLCRRAARACALCAPPPTWPYIAHPRLKRYAATRAVRHQHRQWCAKSHELRYGGGHPRQVPQGVVQLAARLSRVLFRAQARHDSDERSGVW